EQQFRRIRRMRTRRYVVEIFHVGFHKAFLPGVSSNENRTDAHASVAQRSRKVVFRLPHVKIEKHYLFPGKGSDAAQVHRDKRLAFTRNRRTDGYSLRGGGWIEEIEVRPECSERLRGHRLRMVHYVQHVSIGVVG